MRLSGLQSDFPFQPGGVSASEPGTAPHLSRWGQNWQAIHARFADFSWAACSPPEIVGFAIYRYCVYKAFGQEQDARLARQQYALLANYLGNPLLAQDPGQLAMLAWMHCHLALGTPALSQEIHAFLTQQDQFLLQEALALPVTAESRPRLFALLHYFSHRFPDQHAHASLQQLLDRQLALQPLAPQPLALGLRAGQAGELLLLLRICRQQLLLPTLRQDLRTGILRLLAGRREADFLVDKYSIFPDYLNEVTGEASFSAELSWQHGDLVQAWLLYEAQELLQDAELTKIAELVGLNTLLRTTSQATGIVSAQFDRGAAGTATLYRKLYQLSGHAAYQHGYHFWLGQTQKLLAEELAAGRHAQPGDLATGLVGTGLVLLSALTEQDLGWETLLL